MAKLPMLGMFLTLTFFLSPGPAHTFSLLGHRPAVEIQSATLLKSMTAEQAPPNCGLLEVPPFSEVIPPNRRFLAKLLTPLAPGATREAPALGLTGVSPWSAPLAGRIKPDNLLDRLLTYARHFLDTPYRRGGSLRDGRATDCSGFVKHIYQRFDIELPRSSAAQARVGKVAARTMDFSKLQRGDLLFFSRAGWRIGHVGIYLGEAQMIHASTRGYGVIVSDLDQPYYGNRFVVAKRVINTNDSSFAPLLCCKGSYTNYDAEAIRREIIWWHRLPACAVGPAKSRSHQ